MGFYSQVQITAEKNAFGMFEDILRKHGIRHRVLGTDGVKVISIDWVKWYPEFDSVREVEKAQRRLCADEYDMDGWGYKTIILNEDNSTEVYCNETGEILFSDFEILCEISNPYAVGDAGEDGGAHEQPCR